MAWQHTFEKKGCGPRASRKEGSKASRGNVERDIAAEPISAGGVRKQKAPKRFGIECRWPNGAVHGGLVPEWHDWCPCNWYETEKRRDHALAQLQKRPTLQYRAIDR